ncbi:MAG: prepilin-type N-terminal cleavage/methylation domain-containing protein [Candidatus Xenobia bacterium]
MIFCYISQVGMGRCAVRRSGFSLLEMIVSISLVAFVIITLLGLVPIGVKTLAHADQVQTAALYGNEVLEDTIYNLESYGSAAMTPVNAKVSINQVDYQVQETTQRLDPGDSTTPPLLVEIDVNVTWYGMPQGLPISSRVYLDQ